MPENVIKVIKGLSTAILREFTVERRMNSLANATDCLKIAVYVVSRSRSLVVVSASACEVRVGLSCMQGLVLLFLVALLLLLLL